MTFKMSASTLAALALPGVPKTKVGVRTLAERENWPFEETTGVGGKRRVYEIPKRFNPLIQKHLDDDAARRTGGYDAQLPPQETGIAGTVVAGTSKVDTVKLELAIRALTEFEAERGIKVSDERRPAVIAILYDYLQNSPELAEGEKAMGVVLRALG